MISREKIAGNKSVLVVPFQSPFQTDQKSVVEIIHTLCTIPRLKGPTTTRNRLLRVLCPTQLLTTAWPQAVVWVELFLCHSPGTPKYRARLRWSEAILYWGLYRNMQIWKLGLSLLAMGLCMMHPRNCCPTDILKLFFHENMRCTAALIFGMSSDGLKRDIFKKTNDSLT